MMNPLKKNKFFRSKEKTKPARITTKTVEQFRREILDSAKKFKYPVQYEKHKLVINAILVSIAAFVMFFGIVGWQLYKTNNMSAFLYKVVQIVPLRAGKIDGQPILLSDYMGYYRSSWHYQEHKNISSLDKAEQDALKEDYRKQAFDNAVKIAFAKKIAADKKIVITDKEFKQELDSRLTYNNTKISVESFDAIIKEYYGFNQKEYQTIFIKYPLLLKKIVMIVDDEARELIESIHSKLVNDKLKIADVKDEFANVGFSDSGLIRYKTNDSGRSEEALKLSPGQISKPFVSRDLDSYSILQLISKDEELLHYHTLRVPLTKFKAQLNHAKDNQLKTYILK